ncbi:MAG: lipid II flippase MurJ, partial [Lautropia sp.]|nr:lipid II flippase MurJ [Lautropia sp.]
FYAKQDVRTPVKIAVSVLVCTQLMNLALVPWLAHAGLALSISLGAWMNALWLLHGLKKRGSYRPGTGWMGFILRVLLALAALAALLGWGTAHFDWAALQAQPWLRAGLVLGMVAGGAAAYFAVLLMLGLKPWQMIRPPKDETAN